MSPCGREVPGRQPGTAAGRPAGKKYMRKFEAERLIVSFFIALGFFGLLAIGARFLPWERLSFPVYSGPLQITIDLPEEMRTRVEVDEEPLPAEVREEPAEEETAPRRGDPDRPSRNEVPRPETERSAQSAAAEQRAAAEPAGRGRREEPLRQDGRDTAPEPAAEREVPRGREETEELPSEVDVPAREDAREEVAEAERTVRPREEEPVRGRTGEQEGETAEPAETVSEGAEAASPEEAPREEGLYGDLDRLDEALARAGEGDRTASEADDAAGTQPGDGGLGTAGAPIEMETLTAARRPLSLPQPEISAELARNLPRQLEVVISFQLLPTGYIGDLKFITDSGNTVVNSIISEAIRKWRFEPVSRETGSVQVRVKYQIRIR